MSKSIKFFLLSLLVSGMLASSALASMDTLVVNSAQVKSPVGIWWPANKKDAPVIVWFHGEMTSANCQKGLVAGDDLSKLYPSAVVLSASACRGDHWATAPMTSVVDLALDSVAAVLKRPVDKISLVGVSDGAIGVYFYSLNGRRQVQDRLLVSSNGSMLGDSRELAMQSKFKTGRWRFLQGGADRLYPSSVTIPWIESFCKTVKVDCDMRYDSAGEHDWAYWKINHQDWIFEAVSSKNK